MAEIKPIRKERKSGRENPPAKDSRSSIEALAYQLWLERGAPIGSPQADWFEAEARLSGETQRRL
ncbi:MAG TPA: DUF2934 domain-containing protein [Terracidiphilus sp.]|nr:DUF2934 domain-containing protein [Terracidiphilus sp.]